MSDARVFGVGGATTTLQEPQLLARLDEARGRLRAPFAPERLALVSAVSEALRRSEPLKQSPPVAHFAFWIRRAAIDKLARSFADRLPQQTIARARGVVFHLPPQNVETVFLYSWLLSYLAGNANVIRLPSEVGAEMRQVLDLFLQRLAEERDETQIFLHFPSSSDLSVAISAASDARVVWGGDAKVSLFARMPLRKGGKALWFGDRFSFSALSGTALARFNDHERRTLAWHLFNDIFVFDQMACSSPHTIYVVGSREAHGAAIVNLLDAIARIASEKGWRAPTGHVIHKMVKAFREAAIGSASEVVWRDVALASIVVDGTERREMRVGGGFLNVAFISSLDDLQFMVREHDQTITHFGFDTEEINAVAQSRTGLGLSRWAPAGSALDFDFVWDGYDIPVELTRFVRLA